MVKTGGAGNVRDTEAGQCFCPGKSRELSPRDLEVKVKSKVQVFQAGETAPARPRGGKERVAFLGAASHGERMDTNPGGGEKGGQIFRGK